MKTRKSIMVAMAVMLVMTWASFAFGAASPEEAAKLGTTLTGLGAEKAGNKDGTIPAYTGGLTKPPAGFKSGSGKYDDPFAGEKPLFSINAQNMAQYADKLTEGTKFLMKKFPGYRIDIYKTHRTAAVPEYIIVNTAKNAVKATTTNGGLTLKGAHAGTPFPIPKDGYEAMWNHLTRYTGRALEEDVSCWIVDNQGKLYNTSFYFWWEEVPYYDEDTTRSDADLIEKWRCVWSGPARRIGEGALLFDSINPYEKGRIAYQYLPGQRRVKLAPEFAFDTPNFGTSGVSTFDEVNIFNGSMERYNMKLIGKREIYIPYNTYKMSYQVKPEELFGPKYFNPDLVRWELHRVWVVEGTLKPGKRHKYHRRTIYLDEDTWSGVSGENYDANGVMYTINFVYQAPAYDIVVPCSRFMSTYNMISGVYSVDHWAGKAGFLRAVKVRPERDWAPASLAGTGVR
jgi:hypothetical protein